MAKLCLKKPSKRMPARRRYKIAKNVREHNRKKRKEAKKLANKPLKKLIHVPNICPFKEDILKDVELYKKHREMEKQEAREKAKAERESNKAKNLEEFVENAQGKQVRNEEKPTEDLINRKGSDNRYKTYYREFQKVVHSADVILEVVDARDPVGTRCPTVEQSVQSAGESKRLILVLNKADLVPREILNKWLKHLRKHVPAIPFKSSTQLQGKKLGQRKMKKKVEIKGGGVCIGAEGLMSLLANYTRNKGIKTSIRVGVVGMPNVGKSSLINSLKRSRACAVGAVPGVTRSLQEVQLDQKIKLLDSPGLVLASNADPHAALKNSVHCTDWIEPAEMILARANKHDLMTMYLLPEYQTPGECLSYLAKRYGHYKKGGIPDPQAAAKVLVDDWNRGKISYHTAPPEESSAHEVSSTIITAPASEFDLDAYDNQVFADKQEEMDVAGNDEEAVGDTPVTGSFVVTGSKKKRFRRRKAGRDADAEDSALKLEGNLRFKKVNKMKFKKLKKQRARAARTESKLAEVLENVKL